MEIYDTLKLLWTGRAAALSRYYQDRSVADQRSSQLPKSQPELRHSHLPSRGPAQPGKTVDDSGPDLLFGDLAAEAMRHTAFTRQLKATHFGLDKNAPVITASHLPDLPAKLTLTAWMVLLDQVDIASSLSRPRVTPMPSNFSGPANIGWIILANRLVASRKRGYRNRNLCASTTTNTSIVA